MNILKHIRTKAGMTQQQMASYLSVPLGRYAMAEGNHRELPLEQMQKITLLYAKLESQAQVPYCELVNESEVTKKLKEELAKTKLREESFIRKLASMMLQQKQNLSRKRQVLMQKREAQQNDVASAHFAFSPSDESKLDRSLRSNGALQQIFTQINAETARYRATILEEAIRAWEAGNG